MGCIASTLAFLVQTPLHRIVGRSRRMLDTLRRDTRIAGAKAEAVVQRPETVPELGHADRHQRIVLTLDLQHRHRTDATGRSQ